MKYVYEESSWRFDDYGREYLDEICEEREAVLVFSKPVNYCDGEEMYFAECGEDEAKRICDEINAQRTHQYCDYAKYQMVPHGALIRVITPYND